jgi:WS/DGAT/MGAT family acyltransferase
MEHPTNLMMVTGVLTLARPLDFDHFRALIETRLLSFDRFRQRVVKPGMPLAPPYWEVDPHFDLSAHLHRIALPHPHDKLALQKLVSDLMSTPLDFSKPLWQMHVVEGYGDKGALIVRLHHCIADGMALVGVLLALTEMTPGTPPPTVSGELVPLDGKNGAVLGSETLGALSQRASSWMDSGVGLGRRALIAGLESYLNHDRPRQLVEKGTDYTYTASKLVLMSSDPKTALKGPLGVAKRVAWSRAMPLGEVKSIRKATGATINDLMITAVAGALGRYLEARGEETDGVTIRAVVPVNLRKPEEMGEMGNKFGLVFADLPVGVRDLKQRLAAVQKNMNAHKDSLDAPVSLDILAGMGLSPQVIENFVLKLFAGKATAVMTNVPGPPIPLYMAGDLIENLMFWVPQAGRLAIGISILSYAGQVMLGIAVDAALIPDPDAIVNAFYMEYDELLKLV